MYCGHCGKKISESDGYCPYCGKPTDGRSDVVAAEIQPRADRPKKRKSKKGGDMPLPVRIIIMLCAVILAVHTLGTLAVGICGESARATGIHLSFNKKEPTGGKNDYQWTLDYHFTANGKEYSGFTIWHGTRWSADGGYGKYHVNYLPFLPQINRFQKHNSLMNADDLGDALAGAATTLFTTALGGVASWFMLALTIPGIPFFAFGKKRKKKQQNSEKTEE